MRKFMTIATILLSAAVVGSWIGLSAEGEPAPEVEPTVEEIKHLVGLPDTIPAHAKDLENPQAPTKKSLEHGGLLFSSQCVMCHGTGGKGDGDLIDRFEMEIPDLTDPAFHKEWTDGQLYYVLSHGHGRMPSQNRFKELARWDMVKYIRSLEP